MFEESPGNNNQPKKTERGFVRLFSLNPFLLKKDKIETPFL